MLDYQTTRPPKLCCDQQEIGGHTNKPPESLANGSWEMDMWLMFIAT